MSREKFGIGNVLGMVSVEESSRLSSPWTGRLQIIAVTAGEGCLQLDRCMHRCVGT